MIVFFLAVTFLSYWILLKDNLKFIENGVVKISVVSFLSTYISVFCIFALAILFSPFTSNLLFKASYAYVTLEIIYLLINHSAVLKTLRPIYMSFRRFRFLRNGQFFLLIGSFLFSYLLFRNFLTQVGSKIYTSFLYWDFPLHVDLIQNFTFGDNFPPQYEVFPGIYNLCHYFWALIPSIFQIFGLNLAQAVTLYSSIFLGLIIFLSMGIVQKYINAKVSYLLIPLFLLTHGSFKFIDFFKVILQKGNTLFQWLTQTTGYFTDFNYDGKFGYNGNMFNMFYFIEERQLIFACFALLVFIAILLNIDKLENKILVILGILFGIFVQWHLFITVIFITVGTGYACLTSFFKKPKGTNLVRKFLVLIIPLIVFSTIYILALSLYSKTNPNFFHLGTNQFPRFNFTFTQSSTSPQVPFTILNIIKYYLYMYGFRIFLYGYVFYYTFKKERKLFYLLLSFIPIFIFINTIQLSPLSIYDNHKWTKPFNLVLDLFAIAFTLNLVFKTKFLIAKILFTGIYILSILSGMMFLANLFFQKPDIVYADLESPIYKTISSTPPRSIFLTNDAKIISLAGRKAYSFDYLSLDIVLRLDMSKREDIKNDIYRYDNATSICRYIKHSKLIGEFDYIYFPDKNFYMDIDKECRFPINNSGR